MNKHMFIVYRYPFLCQRSRIVNTCQGGSVCVINKAKHHPAVCLCGVWLHPAVVVSWSESETRGCLPGILSGCNIQTLTSPTWCLIYNGRWFHIPRIYFWGWLYTTTFKSCLCGRSPKYTLTTPGYLKVKVQSVRSGCHAWSLFHLTKNNKYYDLLL